MSRIIKPDASFTPRELFARMQGAWFEPRQGSMWQENTGVTPTTSGGQTIGLLLGLDQQQQLGPELITNNNLSGFSTVGSATVDSTTQFTLSGNNISNRVLYSVGTGTTTDCIQFRFVLQANKTATVVFSNGWGVNTSLAVSGTPASYTLNYIGGPAGNTQFPMFYTSADSPVVVTITNISARKILGNHAFQTTAANRPLLGARRNLLTYSEDFSNPVWVAVFGVLTNNAASAPDGTLTAALHTHNQQYSSLLYVYYNFTVGNTYTVSFWARRSSGANTLSVFSGSTNNVIGTFTPTQTWTKYSFSFTALGTFDEIYFAQDRNDSGFTTVELWHPQLELGSVATDYQRVTTATDYDPGPYPALAHDSTDSLVVTLPDLGGGVFSSAGSVYFATSVGMSCLHNQSIGTSYNLPAPQTDNYCTVITPARLAPPLEQRLALYMNQLAGLSDADFFWQEQATDGMTGQLLADDNDIILLRA